MSTEKQLWHHLADAARELLKLPPELRGPFKTDEESLRRVAALPPRTKARSDAPPPPHWRKEMSDDLELRLDANRTLWLTEISRATFEDQALDALGGDGGLFVVLEDTTVGRFDVLAKAVSSSAGAALLDVVAKTLRPRLTLIEGAGKLVASEAAHGAGE